MKNALKFLLLFSLFLSCATQRGSSKYDYIRFGAGGGITGYASGFIIKNNGDLFKWSRTVAGNYSEEFVKRLASKKVNEALDKLKESDFTKISLNDPGNMTYSIEFSQKGKKHEVSWGGSAVPPKVADLYGYLSELSK